MDNPVYRRPKGLDHLTTVTHFSRPELKRLYRAFKAEAPTGLITEETFRNMYSQFFPKGGKLHKCSISPVSLFFFFSICSLSCSFLVAISSINPRNKVFHFHFLFFQFCCSFKLYLARLFFSRESNSIGFDHWSSISNLICMIYWS